MNNQQLINLRILVLLVIVLFSQGVVAQLDSIYSQNSWRTFIVHLPVGYNANNEYPLVLNLHGLGANANQQKNLTKFNDISDEKSFIVVYPNAINESWKTNDNSDVEFLNDLVDSIKTDYSCNDCLFVTGFSQGGFMTYKFATTTMMHPIKAIAIGSGNMSTDVQDASENAPQVPVMHFHGTDDNLVRFNGSPIFSIPPVEDTIQWWVNHNNCNQTPVISAIDDIDSTDNSNVQKYYYANENSDNDVTFYKVKDGGHSWSNPNSGNANRDINQSMLIGAFFESFCSVTLGLENVPSDTTFSLYPNPFTDQFTLDNPTNVSLKFFLYDSLSRHVLKEEFNFSKTFFTEKLPSGMYFYEIWNVSSKVQSGKIIKN